MSLDMVKITAALNAYPWTSGRYSVRDGGSARYCAVGLLLRYAGVAQAEIECAGPLHVVVARYGDLLKSEYGISDMVKLFEIVCANDSATSHERAIEQVQFVLGGGRNGDQVARDRAAAEALAAEVCQAFEDEGGACGALIA